MSFFQARNVSVEFLNPVTGEALKALDNVSVEIKDGEFFTICGPSGCGKSTFLLVVEGLVKPSTGEILIEGRKVVEPGSDRAMVFQESSLLPWRSLKGNVELGLEARRLPKMKRDEISQKYLDLVGLSGFERYHSYQVSGGMKQRAGLARALAVEPKILLMDEPFASVDAQTKEFLQSDLLKIWSATKKTIIYVTHSLDEAIYLSDRVAIMSSRPGRFVEILEIDIPRPRAPEIMNTNRFIEYRQRAWEILKAEVVMAREQEMLRR